MQKSQGIESHIKSLMTYFPSITGIDRLKALNQILITYGNRMEWDNEGRLRSTYKYTKDKEHPTAKEAFTFIFQMLEQLPEVTQKRVQGYNTNTNTLYWKFAEEDKLDEKKWIEYHKTSFYTEITNIQNFCVLQTMVQPPYLSRIDLEYSHIGRTPKNVQPDYAEAILELLQAAITTAESNKYNWDNAVTALTLLIELEPILAPKCKKYPTQKTILGLMRKTKQRREQLDQKRHTNNQKIDETKLNNNEYFEFHRLGMGKLKESQLNLIRKYHQYTKWLQGYIEETQEKGEKDNRAISKKFWKAAKITKKSITIDITKNKEIYQWAKLQKRVETL